MNNLNFFDYVLIIGYFAVLIGIGFYLKKKASASLDDYFLGGRKLPWWALGISGMAAWLDLTGTMLITSFLFLVGPTALFVELRGGVGLVLVFMFLFIGKWHRRSGLMTSAEWMIFRFGNGFWGHFARIAQVIAILLFSGGMLAYSIKGVGLFLSMFIPFKPSTCAAIMMAITCIYLIQSGFYGMIVTDVFQSACILVGVIFVVIFAMMKVHGADLSAVAVQVTGNTHWVQSLPGWKMNMPAGYEQYNFLGLVTVFFLFKTVFQGMGIYVDNRYFGAAGDRECGLLGFMSGWTLMMRWPLMMGFTILGLFLVRANFPDQQVVGKAAQAIHGYFETSGEMLPANLWPEKMAEIINKPDSYGELPARLYGLLGEDWQRKVNLVSYEGTIYPERILPAVLLSMIPTGVRGLLIVALMAAAMSTFNTMINSTTSFFTRDIYQGYLRPKAKNTELIYISWAFGVLLFIAGFVMAFYAPKINSIWSWLMGGLAAGLAVPWFLRFYWWRFNGGGFAFGLLAGVAGAVLQRIFIPEMYEWYQFLYILALGFTGCIIGTFLTQQTDPKVLEKFYVQTRPFGLWKPFKNSLDSEMWQKTKQEHKNDILAVPFGIGWLLTLLLLPLQAMTLQWFAFAVTLVIFLVSLAGLYVFWYRHLPPPTSKKVLEEKKRVTS